MKLRSSTPFWQVKDGLIESYPPLRENLSCEVVIIGAGLSGSLLAYQFAEAGVDTIVLDRRDAAFGSTSASTALVMYEIDTPLFRLVKMRGEQKAVRSYRLCLDAVSKIEHIIRRIGSDCSFKRKGSLYLSNNSKQTRDIKREYETRLANGFKVRFVEKQEIRDNFSFSRDSGLASSGKVDAELDPVSFSYSLLRHSTEKGGRVFTRTKASRIRHRRSGVEVETDRGHRIRARKLVFATGYETFHYIKRKVVKLKSTYAMVTEPLSTFSGWGLDRCLIWDASRPYFYMRTTPDNRMMVGGLDEDFVDPSKRDALIPVKSTALLRRVRKMFPGVDARIAYAWAGTFGVTKDSLPFIGEIREFPNAYFDLCYGANGTNFALIGSEIIRDLYLGRKNPDASLFGFEDRDHY